MAQVEPGFTLYCVLCTLYSFLCTLYSVIYTLCSVLFTLCVQFQWRAFLIGMSFLTYLTVIKILVRHAPLVAYCLRRQEKSTAFLGTGNEYCFLIYLTTIKILVRHTPSVACCPPSCDAAL